MSNKNYETIDYGVKPFKTLGSTIEYIGAGIGIAVAILTLKGIWPLVATLTIIIILISVLLIKVSIQLIKTGKNYNELVQKNNFANNNSTSLEKIIKRKNEDIDSLKSDLQQSVAGERILLWALYNGDSESKPKKEVLEQALDINDKEVIDDDRNHL